MKILEDAVAALNFRHIGRTLSKRSTGMVAGSFAFLVVIYVIVFGLWYSAVAGDFIEAALKAGKPYLPSFNIMNGQLIMRSAEPFIITHEDVYAIIIEAATDVDRKRFGGKNTGDIAAGVMSQMGTNRDSFCLVMDTTGRYKEVIDPTEYSKYAIISKDTMELVDRVQYMPGNIVPISERIQQDITFTPDNLDQSSGPLKRIATTIIIIGLALYAPAHFLIKALIGALIGWLIVLMTKRQAKFNVLYKISLYALSPVILLLVASRLGLPNIPGIIFQAIYYSYIVMAILTLPKPEEASSEQK